MTKVMVDFSRRAQRVLAATIAVIPFIWLFIVDYELRREGWLVWRSPVYVAGVVSLLVAACFWARHFLHRSPRLGVALFLFVTALVWITTRTDWIVETNYEYMGQREHRTFTPPIRPLWDPPQPQHLSSTATSWRDWDFFYIGGAGGPTEEPRLRINWAFTILKFTLVTVPGYLLVTLLASIHGCFRRTSVA